MKNIIWIESVIDLLIGIKKSNLIDFFFRGHSNSDWDLTPTIGRSHCQSKYYLKWVDLEDDLLEEFQKFSRPYLDCDPKYKYEWLVIAQHHGLPTRILDWTTNPLKALYFTVENPQFYEENGALWGFRPKGYFK